MSSAARELDEDGRVVLALVEPISLGKLVVDELRLRRPKAKDFRGLPEGNMDKMLAFAARLSGQTSKVIDELGLEDMMTLSEIVADFMPAGLTAGSAT